jgi:hypothetical protein
MPTEFLTSSSPASNFAVMFSRVIPRVARIAFVGLEIDNQPVMYLAIHFLKVLAGMVTVFAMCSLP